MAKEETEIVESRVNVFADLGLPRPDEHLAKARLASAIIDAIEARKLTQAAAAELMGIDQPKVSKIVRGRLSDFSTERLLFCLVRLGLDVDIVVHRKTTVGQSVGSVSISYR